MFKAIFIRYFWLMIGFIIHAILNAGKSDND